jgi:uridine kinase
MQNHSIVIHGPMGCGKTSNGEKFAKHFGLTRVLEADNLARDKRPWPKMGAVILTCETPADEVRRKLTFAQAMKLLQGKPGYPF